MGVASYLGGCGGMLPKEFLFYLYVLKSILVHSETNIINRNYSYYNFLMVYNIHESSIAKNSLKLASWYFGVCMSHWKMCESAACLCVYVASIIASVTSEITGGVAHSIQAPSPPALAYSCVNKFYNSRRMYHPLFIFLQ